MTTQDTERSMAGYDMHLRYTDNNGKTHDAEHRVYDGEKFFLARLAEQRKEGGFVERITEEAYRAARQPK